jgi:hypothetical protein
MSIDELLKMPTRRDQWGRYKVLTPEGKVKGYTRATTVAKALDDGAGWWGWGKRMVALGLAQRPDLVALVASIGPDDKKALDGVCERAAEAGGSTIRRDLGTALHAALEESWVDMANVPAPFVDDVAAVHATLKAAGLSVVSSMIERMVVMDRFEIAGTFDLIVTDGEHLYMADIKTGATLLGAVGFAVQLSIYANADNLYRQGEAADGSEDVREAMPALDKERGLIIHVQPYSGECDLHWIDLALGAEALELAMQVRTTRKARPLTKIKIPATPKKVEEVFTEALVEAFPGAEEMVEVSEAWRAWMRERIAGLVEAGFKADLLNGWPEGVATLASGDLITVEQGDELDALVSSIEARYQLPFAPPEPKEAGTDWTRDVLAMRQKPVIDEGNEISEAEVARVRGYAQELDPQYFEALGLLLGAAHQENYSLRLTGPGGKPTARRALITEALLSACQWDIEVLKAALKHARDFDDSMTIGFAIGTLSIDQALNLRRIFEALEVNHLLALEIKGSLVITGDVEAILAA